MMGTGDRLGEPVEDGSGLRRVRRWRLLLAHDATAATCDPLVDAVEGALGNVDINESSSIDDARVALHSRHDGGGAPGYADGARPPGFDLAMVCLDLPPAPLGGVRLAQEFLREGLPVVLVTRSLRWIPPSAIALRDLPWVTPDATAAEVERAVSEVTAKLRAPSRSARSFTMGAPPPNRSRILPARSAGGE
jgi:hypothetical protein